MFWKPVCGQKKLIGIFKGQKTDILRGASFGIIGKGIVNIHGTLSFRDSFPLYLLGFYMFGLTDVRKSGIIIG